MLPSEKELMFCVMLGGEIVDGAHGLAIGATEREAWEKVLDPCADWSIEKFKDTGAYVRRCAVMVINP